MSEFIVGNKYELGSILLTEQEIIDFAKLFDPLDIHVNKEAAKKSIFKGLIASGPHIFNLIYKKEWIPRFGKTVVCGMEISHWKFIKPIYANQKTIITLTILSVREEKENLGIVVSWLFEFKNEQREMVQLLQMEVLHKDTPSLE